MESSLDAIFSALSDPTSRAILGRLAHGKATVAELADPFELSQPAISKHLKVLEQAGLIRSGREGTSRPRELQPDALKKISDWIGD
ncbi:ArsR/SmtB family transcription factor, partial [Rhizobium ruizarguesonis]